MPRLIIEEGLHKGREFRFSSEAMLGRSKDCLVTIEDPRLSLHHAKIALVDGKYVLKDLTSRNGTFHNGERIQEADLTLGDKLRMGTTVFVFAEDPKGKWAGRVIAGYEILDLAGQGGMGIVYKARQISLDRIVALKLMHEHLMKDPKYVERFLIEAKAAAALNHPGIVQVHDVGCENDVYFFSMEYIDGVTLAERLQKGPAVSVQEAVRIVSRTAEALAYAHDHRIIHRDVKPDNILIGANDDSKLADLGVAKCSHEVDTREQGKRVLVGTPAYISPEEILGKGAVPASDLYSLGATFYHVLTGRAPYISPSVTETIRMHLHGTPPDIRKYNPAVPADLCRIVEKMMAKDLAARYRDARDVVDALKKPLGLPGRIPGGSGRRGALYAALAAAGILAAIGLSAAFRPAPSASDGSAAGGPETTQSLLEQGIEAENERRYADAEKLYRQVMEIRPSPLHVEMAQQALERLASQQRKLEREALEREYETILARTAQNLGKRLELLAAFQPKCSGVERLFESVKAESERTRDALDQENARKADQQARRNRKEQEFQDRVVEIDRVLRERTGFGKAWKILQGLQASHAESPWKDRLPDIQKRLSDGMNGHLENERRLWNQSMLDRRYRDAWKRLQQASQAFQGTLVEGLVDLARKNIASDIEVAFEADIGAWRRKLVQEFRFKEASLEMERLGSLYAGTPCEETCQLEADRAQALLLMQAELIARIQAVDASEQLVVEEKKEQSTRKLKIISADSEQMVVERQTGSGTARVRENRAWTSLSHHDVYTIYLHYLDKRRTETHRWLHAFCSSFDDLSKEAADHLMRR